MRTPFNRKTTDQATLSTAQQIDALEADILKRRAEIVDLRREASELAVDDMDKAVELDSRATSIERLLPKLEERRRELYAQDREEKCTARDTEIEVAMVEEAKAVRELSSKILEHARGAMNHILALRALSLPIIAGIFPVGLDGEKLVKYELSAQGKKLEEVEEVIRRDLEDRLLPQLSAAASLLKQEARDGPEARWRSARTTELIPLANLLSGRLAEFKVPPEEPPALEGPEDQAQETIEPMPEMRGA